jgi:hypothetical protein
VLKTLSAPVVVQTFPGGTVDPGFTVTIVGSLADGTPFAQTFEADEDGSVEVDLEPGRYVGQVSKLGVSSLPSDELVLEVPTTVSISVPDVAAKATFA